MIKNSELHSLKNLERFKNVKKHQKLWITTNINSKLKIEFGIALTINKGSFRICTHQNSELHSQEFGIALTEKVAQTLFYKSIEYLIKSIIKVIKKFFFI